tara:strand:- start:351 stop:806 length:456 start_codon:yes stop_codon:yes gene_type:complete
MPNYQNGKIYKIYHQQNEKIYIGSTTQTLSQRLAEHKKKLTCRSKCLFNYETLPTIELLENYSCNSKLELRQREQNYLDLYEDIKLNIQRAVMTKEDRNKYMCEFRKRPYMKDKLKATQKKHNELAKVKVVCNKCDKTFSKSSMWKHEKIC